MTFLAVAFVALLALGRPVSRFLFPAEPEPTPWRESDADYGRRLTSPGYHAGGRR